jgi:hypothetical protein
MYFIIYAMNGYSKILLVSIILIIISIIKETNYPFINNNNLTISEYLHIYLIRYIHYVIYIMSCFYLLFFNGIGTNVDAYFYLTLIFITVLGWYLFESCCLSYFELLFYNIDLEKTDISYHPIFISLFNNYDSLILEISSYLYVANVIIILYYLKSVKIIYKIIYFILFLFLFIESLFISNVIFYSPTNKYLLFFKNIYNKYMKN